MDRRELAEILKRAAGKRVVCIGDLMLDRFVYGSVNRISPEAPVAVMRETRVSEMPGGAANVARNLSAMGLQVSLLGLAGSDLEGASLASAIAGISNIDPHITISNARHTTLKTRFVAGGQQMIRVDRETSEAISENEEDRLIETVESCLDGAHAVILSDYAKGVVSPRVAQAVIAAANAAGIPVLVDPKTADLSIFKGASIIKPNARELSDVAGLPVSSDEEAASALTSAKAAIRSGAIVVTRAEKGMSWIDGHGEVFHAHGVAREVFDVSGAGDTSLAALTLGLVAGGALKQAVELAIIASGLAVAKAGTAAVSAADIAEFSRHDMPGRRHGVLDISDCAELAESWREQGLKVGFTNGCFDILHPGHIKVIEEARSRCDRLIVAINSDASVARLKGPTRPVNGQVSRGRVLSALSAVDAVVVFEDDTPASLLNVLKPDLLVKGGDYDIASIVGADAIIDRGGEVHIVGLVEGESTTSAIERMNARQE